MSLLDRVLGTLTGKTGDAAPSALGSVVTELVAQGGGLDALVQKFHDAGLGGVIGSWIGSGENQAISADMLHQVLGSAQVQQLAARSGLPVDQLLAQLADHLPGIVDRLTPDGRIPDAPRDAGGGLPRRPMGASR